MENPGLARKSPDLGVEGVVPVLEFGKILAMFHLAFKMRSSPE
jgi:hypothetical protein